MQRAGQALVLNVSFTSADPGKAARLANAVADAYVVDKLDARFEAAKRASAWLSDRLVELTQQLRDSEEAVAQFRADNNLVQAAAQASTLNQEQLAQFNGRLVAARAETAEKKARLELLQRVSGQRRQSSPTLPDIDERRRHRRPAQAGERPQAPGGRSAGPLHRSPSRRRQRARAIGRHSPRDRRRSRRGSPTDIKHDYELAQARQDAVEKTLREVTGQTDLDASKAITLRELERNAAVNKSLFEDFLQRSRVTEEQSTFEARDARVITPALPPGVPSSPKTQTRSCWSRCCSG